MTSLFLFLAPIVFLLQCAHANHLPTVQEEWIFTMISLGFISSFLLTVLIIGAIYKIYQRIKINKKPISTALTALDFANWCFNALACYEWAFLRTDLFIELDVQKCTIIYISNYLFYMSGKYCLHILLLYRLYMAFSNTILKINSTYAKCFASLITIDFIVFVSLWMSICFGNVSVGITVPSKTLKICTLYNDDSKAERTIYDIIWPILFGGQDLIVGIAMLFVFIYKINQVIGNRHIHDIEMEMVIRKSFILGSISIFSTFVFYTFAVPFYPNLTFLLPFDSLINSLCVLLICDWSHPLYNILCRPCDIFFTTLFRHKHIKKRNSSINASKVHLDGIELEIVFSNHMKLTDVPSYCEGGQLNLTNTSNVSNVSWSTLGKSLSDLRSKHGDITNKCIKSLSDPLPLIHSVDITDKCVKASDPWPLSQSF